jgi:hypothetical protein
LQRDPSTASHPACRDDRDTPLFIEAGCAQRTMILRNS